ncbi:MAG: carboxypeptidase regulatory-like domain-containing protein [Acidobacteriota bacterium]
MRLITIALVAALLVIGAPAAFGQVTTGSIAGTVVDANGDRVPGVTVTAKHQPTGITYVVVTNNTGRYNVVNARIGGPYSVEATLEGFKPQQKTNAFVQLGETTEIDFDLSLEAIEETLVITAEANPIIEAGHQGATTNVGTQLLEDLPTLSRGFEDFARLSPHFTTTASGDGPTNLSVAGRNNRYNSVLIDGAVNNDLFGLAGTGTPGGQAETTPISLDAVEELQLLVSPYDVRQGGFSGGGINAVTRSGTNNLAGSVFFFTRDQDLVGDGADDRELGPFSQDEYGFRLGGALAEDKVFFFVNGEISERERPNGFSIGGATGQNFGFEAEANRFVSILNNQYGYDPGSTEEFIRNTDSDKFFGRLDFNLGIGQQLVLRHNYVDASNDRINASSFTYEWPTNAYAFNSETNSTVLQLNSVFGDNFFNEARLNFSSIEDRRAGDTRFPFIEVDLPNGRQFEAGTERFSTANELDQDILEITNDLTWVRGDHTYTIGTSNQLFSFRNLFIRDNFGAYRFNNLDDFEAGLARSYDYSFSNTGDPLQAAEFDVNQYGIYLGDQWAVKSNFTLYYGLRVDAPYMPDTPTRNPIVEQVYGRRTDITADGNLQWSPRVGFNWDINADGTQQLRGGIGIFSGQAPFVWLSNQYSNTGIEFTRVSSFAGDIPFVADPDNQPTSVGNAATNEVNLVNPDFTLPQVLRATLGYDRQLDILGGLVASAELIWANTQEDILYQNLNFQPSGETLFDGRPRLATVNSDFRDVIFLDNTSEGEQISANIRLERPFRDGWFGFISYTYGESESINDGTSSQARSNWRFLPIIDPNNPDLAPSNFDIEDRFNVALSYTFDLIPNAPTTVALFYDAQSGRPYSTTFRRDINGDFNDNDLIFVPATADDVIVTGGTWEELDAYISADAGLDAARGSIVKRNASRAPWQHQLDFRLTQDVNLGNSNFELTLDIINLSNLLDSDSGQVRYVNFNEISPVSFTGIDDATGKPIYNIEFSDPDERFETDDLRSRWQMKLGARFTF